MEKVVDFRPISLCGASYKLISKLIVNRIKLVLDQHTSPSQSSFVSGHSIMNNIILVKEIAHSVAHNKNKIKPLAIKVDLSKAYDRLKGHFIQYTWIPL